MKLLRLIVFQALWFGIIYLGNSSIQYLAIPIALMAVVLDKIIFYKNDSNKSFFLFSLFVLTSGVVVDSILLQSNQINFSNWNYPFSAWFMWGMWIIFIPYYNIGFNKLHKKYLLGSFLGLFFAPISYYSGSNIGNITLATNTSLLFIGIGWAIYFPISLYVHKKLTVN